MILNLLEKRLTNDKLKDKEQNMQYGNQNNRLEQELEIRSNKMNQLKRNQTKDYHMNDKQQYHLIVNQIQPNEDDSKLNILDIDKSDTDNSAFGYHQYKKQILQNINDSFNPIQNNESINQQDFKSLEIKKCSSNKVYPIFSPKSPEPTFINKFNQILPLENQIVSPMVSSHTISREDKEQNLLTPSLNSFQQRGFHSQNKIGNNNQLHYELRLKLTQQKSLQLGQSISSEGNIYNFTKNNFNISSTNISNQYHRPIISRIGSSNNNVLKSPKLRQKRIATYVYPLSKSRSNEITPKGQTISKQKSLAMTQQYFNTMTNYNFTNAINENMLTMNNLLSSTHSAGHKFQNIANLNSSIMSGMNSPLSINNSSVQAATQGNKIAQMIKKQSGFFKRNQWSRALRIIYVQRFKKKMLSLIAYRFKHSLTPNQLLLIGDKSHFIEIKSLIYHLQSKLTSCCSIIFLKLPFFHVLQSVGTYIQHIEAIQPNSSPLLLWKLLVTVISFISVYYYSLKAAFDIGVVNQFSNYSGLSIVLFFYYLIFVIDLIIDINTGFYSEGIIQHSRKKIIQRSLRFDMWVHVLKILLQYYQFYSDLTTYQSYLLCFLHLYSMSKDFQPLDQHQQLQQRLPVLRLVLLLLIVILTVAHLSGCFFYSISLIPFSGYSMSKFRSSDSDAQEDCYNWVNCSSLEDKDWTIKYVFSLYFSFITMITVGYGDIFPVSVYEKIYVIIMTCVSCGIFGYAINKIGSVINELAQKQHTQKQELHEIINYMHNRQISKQTQIKILKFIEHVQEKEKENPINGQLILKKVSKNLKQQVHLEYFGSILKKSNLFKQTFSEAFLDELITYMNEVLLSPEEVIFNTRETTENMLYFLVDGNIGVYSNFNQNEFRLMETLPKKEIFGLTSFFSEQRDENLVLKTIETSLVVSLHHKDFMKCLSNYPNDMEKYHSIKQNIFDSSKRLESCSMCGEYTHTVQKCHLIHLSLNTNLIKMRYQFSQSQLHRDPNKKRKKKQKFNTILMVSDVRKQIRTVRLNYILEARGNQKLDKSIDSEDLNIENDDSFLKRVAQIKFSQNQIKTLSDLNNTGEDSNNSNVSDSDDNNSENSQFQFSHQKAQSYNQIEEMEDEDAFDDIEEINMRKRKKFFSKRYSSYQQEYQRNSHVTIQKSKVSFSQLNNENNSNSQLHLPKSTSTISQTAQITSNLHIKESMIQQTSIENLENVQIQEKQSNQQLLSLQQKKQINNSRPSAYFSDKLTKSPKQGVRNSQAFELQKEVCKSNSLPKNQSIRDKQLGQPQKSNSLPRQSQINLLEVNRISKYVNSQYQKNDNKNISQVPKYSGKIDTVLKSSSLKQNKEKNYESKQRMSLKKNQAQTPPHLKVNFAPSLLNSKPKQDILSLTSKKNKEKIESILKQLKSEEKEQSSSFLSLSNCNSQTSIDKQNNKDIQSQYKNIKIDLSVSSQSDSLNNPNLKFNTDVRTTLPTNQDDFNYIEQQQQQFVNFSNIGNLNGYPKKGNQTTQTDEIKKKKHVIQRKSTLEFDLEFDNNIKQGQKNKLHPSICLKDVKSQQQNNLSSLTSCRDKRNSCAQQPSTRLKSIRGDQEFDNIQSTNTNLPQILDINNNKNIKSINFINEDASPTNFKFGVDKMNDSFNLQKKVSTKANNSFSRQKSLKVTSGNNNNNIIGLNFNINNNTNNIPINHSNNNNNNVTNHSNNNTNNKNILINNQNINIISLNQSNGIGVGNNIIDDQNSPIQNKRTSIQTSNPQKSSSALDDQANQNIVKSSQNNLSQHIQQQEQYQQSSFPNYYSNDKLKHNLFIYDFDQGKEWTYYLPYNNQSLVIKELKKYQRAQVLIQKYHRPRMQQIARQIINKKKTLIIQNHSNQEIL